MSEYFLQRSALSNPAKFEITKDKLELLKNASCIQLEALYIEQKYDFIVENYIEFEQTILNRGLNHLILGLNDDMSFHSDTSLFNRRIMNLLTVFKTYEDTYPQHMNRIFGGDKNKLRKAKENFSEEFDKRVGYWLIPKIRNYVQHQGFPVHASTYGSAWVTNNDGVEKNRYTLDLYISPNELGKGDFNLAVKQRLSKMNKKVDLKFVIRDFMEGFSAAHVKNRIMLNEKINWAVKSTREAIDEFLLHTGYKSSIALFANGPHDRFSVATLADDQRLHFVKKNSSLIRLTDRYISNEVEGLEVETNN